MISLIIPTHNRPQFLARLLRYCRELDFPYTVVVADSSTPSEREANRRCIASLQAGLDVRHEVVPSDTNPYLKIAQALATVDTEYAVLCADKDFVVPRAVEQCVHYLEANPDYSLAHGRAAVIRVSEALSGRRTLFRSSPARTIDQDEPEIRLQDHLQNYTPTFYSVHRRLELMRNMQLAVDNTVDFRFGELLPSCLSVIQGRVRGLDVLCPVRQKHPGHSTAGRTLPLTVLTPDDFSQRYAQFRDCLAEELASVTGMVITEARGAVDHAFTPYWAHLKASHGRSPSGFAQTMQRAWRVIRILPAAAHLALLDRQLAVMARSPREAYRKLQRERALASHSHYSLIDELLEPQSPFHADLLPIYEHVMRYPNGVIPSLQTEETDDVRY